MLFPGFTTPSKHYLLCVLCFCLVLLGGCEEPKGTPTTLNPTTLYVANNTPGETTAMGSTVTIPTRANTASLATPTAPINVVPSLIPSTPTSPGEVILKAETNLVEANNYSFTVSQTAVLTSKGSTILLEANGSGLYVSGNFSQTVNMSVEGKTQPIEIFVQKDQGYQKLSNLKVWRKLATNLYKYGANLPLTSIQTAISTAVRQDQNNIPAFSYILPGQDLVANPNGCGPLPLGLLSASTILNGFTTDDLKAAKITEILQLDGAKTLPVKRMISFEINNVSGETLKYQASYTYKDFNQSGLTLPTPQNLP